MNRNHALQVGYFSLYSLSRSKFLCGNIGLQQEATFSGEILSYFVKGSDSNPKTQLDFRNDSFYKTKGICSRCVNRRFR